MICTAGFAAACVKTFWGTWNATAVEDYNNFNIVKVGVALSERQKKDLWLNILEGCSLIKGVFIPSRQKNNGRKTRYNDYEIFFIDVVREAMQKCDLKEKFRQMILAIKKSDEKEWLANFDGFKLIKNFFHNLGYDGAAESEKLVAQCIEFYHESFKRDWLKAKGKVRSVERLINIDADHMISTLIARG